MAITITKQPEDWYGIVGATVLFSVEATGEGLTYQWEYLVYGASNWSNSASTGNTTANLTFAARSYQNGYKYRCLITDASGNTLRTDEVTLTIVEPTVITKQPENVMAQPGDTVQFAVAAVGSGLTYQWQYMLADSTAWTDWVSESAVTASFRLELTTDARLTASYRCKITDAAGNVTYTDAVKVISVGIINYMTLAQIADAIRAKTGSTATMTPSEMIEAINQM